MGRIMGGADGIDVVFLHQYQISVHILQGYAAPTAFIPVMAVDPLEFHRLPVNKHPPVFQLHPPEADLFRIYFYNAILLRIL